MSPHTQSVSIRSLTGGCQCGQLRYQFTEPPSTLYCCHCTECQAQSASAFGMSLRASECAVRLDGEYGVYLRGEGKANAVEGVFCSLCGTRVMHRGRGGNSGISIKAGSLDEKAWLRPVGHIWASSAQGWVKMDGLIYDQQPEDDYLALTEAFGRILRFVS